MPDQDRCKAHPISIGPVTLLHVHFSFSVLCKGKCVVMTHDERNF